MFGYLLTVVPGESVQMQYCLDISEIHSSSIDLLSDCSGYDDMYSIDHLGGLPVGGLEYYAYGSRYP